MAEALDQAIKYLNFHLPAEKDSLAKIKELHAQCKQSQERLQDQLNYASQEAPGKIETAMREAQTSARRASDVTAEHETVCGEVANHMADATSILRSVEQVVTQVDQVETHVAYLRWLARVEELSAAIQAALLTESVDRAVTEFSRLSALGDVIQTTSARHLLTFVNDTIMFWFELLLDRLAGQFAHALTALNWPVLVSTATAQKQTKEAPNAAALRESFPVVFSLLLKLTLPEKLEARAVGDVHPSVSDVTPPILPVRLMLRPLRLRFRYHFYGKKQTNSLDKPEWYLSQVLGWLRDHRGFLRTRVQPLLDEANMPYVDAMAEFCRGLVSLAVEKMAVDLPEMLYDETIFSHCIDEALIFHRELKAVYGYPETQPGVLQLLTQPAVLDKWLVVERKFAAERMDEMVSAPSAWLVPGVEDDVMRVPECCRSFVTLLQTITERYTSLPGVESRLTFADLQLELLDDFRIRLIQVKAAYSEEPMAGRYAAILNSLTFVISVLRDWSDQPIYVQFYFHKHRQQRGTDLASDDVTDASQLEAEGSLFDEMLQLYEHLENEMMSSIVTYVTDDVKARSKPYRRDKWHAVQLEGGAASGLSSSACEMFLVLRDHLHGLQARLSAAVFDRVWQGVASQLNTFLYSEVVLQNKFSEGGAAQLQYDVTRNLLPLFGQYSPRPEGWFRDVREAGSVLCMPGGSARLLKDVLHAFLHEPDRGDARSRTDPRATLDELGINKLHYEEVELLLSLRVDISMAEDAGVRAQLENPHLQRLLLHLHDSPEPARDMDRAMQEPLFLEFADQALRVVEARDDRDSK